jgi:hypothetical protein
MRSRVPSGYPTQPNLPTGRGRLPATYGLHHRGDAAASRRADYVEASLPPGFGQQRPNPFIASPSTMNCGQNLGQPLEQSTAHSLATMQPSATVTAPYKAMSPVDHESDRRERGANKDNLLPDSRADGFRGAGTHNVESRSIGITEANTQGPRARQELNSTTAPSGSHHPVAGVEKRAMHGLRNSKACATCGRQRYRKGPMSRDSPVCAYCERSVPDAESR